MINQRASRWVGFFILLLLGLRLGRKLYSAWQEPVYENRVKNIKTRLQILADSIESSPETNTAVLLADSTELAPDTTLQTK